MVTYRRHLERRGWHRPWPLRLILIVLGGFVVVFGLLLWSFEQDKGGWEGTELGHFMVEDSPGRAVVYGEGGEVLFEGTDIAEVEAWIENQRHRDFTVPFLVITAGAMVVAVGVAPSPKRRNLVRQGDDDHSRKLVIS